MLTVDISLPDIEELHKLVTDGQDKGFLTYDEIVAGLEEVDLTKEQVEDFYTYLIDHGIELMEGLEHKTPPHEQPALAEEEKVPKLDLTVEPSLDSLRLYNYGFTDFQSVMDHMTQNGSDAVLDLGGGETMTFKDNFARSFAADDFHSAARFCWQQFLLGDSCRGRWAICLRRQPAARQYWDFFGRPKWRIVARR